MLTTLLLMTCLQATPANEPAAEPGRDAVDAEAARIAGRLVGLEFTDAECEQMLGELTQQLAGYRRMQAIELGNEVFPAVLFDPVLPGIEPRVLELDGPPLELPEAERPDDLEELAFAGVPTLASLIRSRKVSCVELAGMYLDRLERLDEALLFTTTVLREPALARAAELDAELERGEWRGPLHGIPYGAKDLLAARGAPTTWGAAPFEHQVIDADATVVRRLDEAGAVLVAKLTLGALAMGDVWYGGRTRSPWDPSRGSSGSSAGSASATAAGCVAFAIGSETYGSIASPSQVCGNSSLRPTFGRVGRGGAMALTWSMDKLGPLCRSLEDAAVVFDAIHGADGVDPSAVDRPFRLVGPVDVTGWRVGYVERAFERREDAQRVLDELEQLGVILVPIELPEMPVHDMLVILMSEAAAAFDELTRSGADDELVAQHDGAWPNLFRAARLIPAVEYLRANRLRTLLCREMDRVMAQVDAYVVPTNAGDSLPTTNLTGHPELIAPRGRGEDGAPRSVSFVGQLYDEARLLALGRAWQAATGYHLEHPQDPVAPAAEEEPAEPAGPRQAAAPVELPAPRAGGDRVGEALAPLERLEWIGPPVPLAGEGAAPATVVRWWTDGCPYCKASLPALEALREELGPRGLRVVGVYHPKPPRAVHAEVAVETARALGFEGPLAVDADWEVLRRFWLATGERDATSVTFLLDAGGVVRWLHPGPQLFPSEEEQYAQEDADYRDLRRAAEGLLEAAGR